MENDFVRFILHSDARPGREHGRESDARHERLGFLARRAREERVKAENASSPKGYRTHVELARLYERRLTLLLRTTFERTVDDPTW
jgi:hypothetical protein